MSDAKAAIHGISMSHLNIIIIDFGRLFSVLLKR